MTIELDVKVGTQTNCGGFTIIKVQLKRIAAGNVEFINRASDVSDHYWQAIQRGAKKALAEKQAKGAVQFTLINALVHPTDANERVFMQAGYKAIIDGLEKL